MIKCNNYTILKLTYIFDSIFNDLPGQCALIYYVPTFRVQTYIFIYMIIYTFIICIMICDACTLIVVIINVNVCACAQIVLLCYFHVTMSTDGNECCDYGCTVSSRSCRVEFHELAHNRLINMYRIYTIKQVHYIKRTIRIFILI